ncbi:MAG: hypothetical protein DRP93_06215 [Candidatus Neomarinimicrobiota bacterium]|nr:MAG: hypothetical protein DRP93_06215 [Candidatus Neomarinimicrobiota bacterium]
MSFLCCRKSFFPWDINFGGRGLRQVTTNNDSFSSTPGYIESDVSFVNATIKSGLTCLYKNTGLYLSSEKLIGDYKFNQKNSSRLASGLFII